MGDITAYRILVEKPVRRQPLWRPRRSWEMDCEDETDTGQALVLAVLYLWVLYVGPFSWHSHPQLMDGIVVILLNTVELFVISRFQCLHILY